MNAKRQRDAEDGKIINPQIPIPVGGGIHVHFSGCQISAPVSVNTHDQFEGMDDEDVPILEYCRRNFDEEAYLNLIRRQVLNGFATPDERTLVTSRTPSSVREHHCLQNIK